MKNVIIVMIVIIIGNQATAGVSHVPVIPREDINPLWWILGTILGCVLLYVLWSFVKSYFFSDEEVVTDSPVHEVVATNATANSDYIATRTTTEEVEVTPKPMKFQVETVTHVSRIVPTN